MKQQLRRGSQTVSFPKSRWIAYATAGVATAACGVTAAEAQITYSGPVNAFFATGSGVAQTFNLTGGAVLRFANNATTSGGGAAIFRNEGAAVSNMFRGVASGAFRYPENVASNAVISAGAFAAFNGAFFATLAYGNGFGGSQFLNPGVGFIGFSFNTGAGTQYGWARVNMQGSPGNAFTLVDYAFGDPGVMIRAGQTAVPEPGSLGLLAVGAAGLVAWRRRRKVAVAQNS